MDEYTLKNLRDDVEDMAPKFGMAPAVEAHFARRDLGTNLVGLAYFRVAPNDRVPFGHTHAEQEEVYVVVEGSGRAKLGDEIVDVGPFDALRVSPQTKRSFAAGPDGLGYLAFGGPSEQAAEADFDYEFWKE